MKTVAYVTLGLVAIYLFFTDARFELEQSSKDQLRSLLDTSWRCRYSSPFRSA